MNQPKIFRAPDVLKQEFTEGRTVLLTIAEAARELRCSKAQVHNIIHGKVLGLPPLPVLRIGRRVLVRAEGLNAWMSELEARGVEAQRLTGFSR